MLEPTLLSRCWVVGGWTALTGFGISSPTSTRQKNRLNSVSLRTSRHVRCFVSTAFLHSFSFCHPNLLTPRKVKHINEFTCTPSSPTPFTTWQNADSSEAFFTDITPPGPCTLTSQHFIQSLCSGKHMADCVEMNNTDKKISRVSNRVFASPWRPGFDTLRRQGAWWETVITMGSLWLSNCHTNDV